MQGFTCFWAFKLRNTLVPRSVTFEIKMDDSFEEFIDQHFKFESTHSWNRIQELVSCVKSLTIRKLKVYFLFYSINVVALMAQPIIDEVLRQCLGRAVLAQKTRIWLDVLKYTNEAV